MAVKSFRHLKASITAVAIVAIIAGLATPAGARPIRWSALAEPATSRPSWTNRIDALVGSRQVSVSIGVNGRFLYQHLATVPRIPASNEKLLLSMALLERFGPGAQLRTRVMVDASAPPVDGEIRGDLWLVGSGDPEVDREAITRLAHQVVKRGVDRVDGSVRGSTGPFARDWWANGWRKDFPAEEVALPTALTFAGNVGPGGVHVDDPERRAAAALTKALRRLGVKVAGPPGAGRAGIKLAPLASIESAPLADIVRRMDVDSNNFDSEVLNKVLGEAASGRPGSIALGAAAIHTFTTSHGAPGSVELDGSGLSYADRTTTRGMVRLLWAADASSWGARLLGALAIPGQGTLKGRLRGLRVRAKTGTLDNVSALSGWVWANRLGRWIDFSILDRGMNKQQAVRIEDAIVRIAATQVGISSGQSFTA